MTRRERDRQNDNAVLMISNRCPMGGRATASRERGTEVMGTTTDRQTRQPAVRHALPIIPAEILPAILIHERVLPEACDAVLTGADRTKWKQLARLIHAILFLEN